MKFFWILAKGDVRGISKIEYFKQLNSKNAERRLIGWVEPSKNTGDWEVCFVKGKAVLSFRVEQLDEVLRIGGLAR